MEKDVIFFEAYLVHENEKNKRGARRRKNMNPRIRGSECSKALKNNAIQSRMDHIVISDSNVCYMKTRNGKQIRGFRVIHPLYLESVQEIFETKKQEFEDECDFFYGDFDFDRNDDWRDYATEESRRQMADAEAAEDSCEAFWDDYEDVSEYQEKILFGLPYS